MCFKRKSIEMVEADARLITVCKNTYGSGNDLKGCLNDGNNFLKTWPNIIPGIVTHKFFEWDATEKNYLESLDKAVSLLQPGATVVILMDSCFSGTATRNSENTYRKNRFIDLGEPEPEKVIRKFARSEFMKWITISACSEHQTAADALIGNQYVGAFSYYAYKLLKAGMTWREWFNTIRVYLPSADFDQIPTIEGPDFLQDRIIGQGQTLIVHNSSHGTWQKDTSGDESDGKDEGLYLDRFVSDDKINVILQKIVL